MKSTSDVDLLRELGNELPHDRPDGERREAMRARLVAEAEDDASANARGGAAQSRSRSRWLFVGGGFAAGLAAAAVIAFVMFGRGGDGGSDTTSAAVIESSSAAELEHVASATNEIVRVHAGKVRLAVGERAARPVVVKTGDAEIGGAGAYELTVDHDKLASLAVTAGHATLSIAGQHTILLAAGETWTAPVLAADLTPHVGPTPDIPTPDVPTPDVPTPDVHAPDVHAPDVHTPDGHTPDVHSSDVHSPDVHSSDVHSADVHSSDVHSSDVYPPDGARVRGPKATDASRGSNTIDSGSNARNVGRVDPRSPTTVTTKPVGSIGIVDPSASGSPPSAAKSAGNSAGSATVAPPDPAVSPTAPEAPEAPPAVTGKSPTEQHFAAGWAALRANEYARAARELGDAADRDDGPLAADARYFQAVAYTRAGRKTEAEHAYVQFLDRAPKSLRRGRAAVALGRLIAERGDRAAAKAWFESAIHDPDPAVAAAAKAALASP